MTGPIPIDALDPERERLLAFCYGPGDPLPRANMQVRFMGRPVLVTGPELDTLLAQMCCDGRMSPNDARRIWRSAIHVWPDSLDDLVRGDAGRGEAW